MLPFVFKNPLVEVVEKSKTYYEVKKIVDENIAKGVEMRQTNFKTDPVGVMPEKYSKSRSNRRLFSMFSSPSAHCIQNRNKRFAFLR